MTRTDRTLAAAIGLSVALHFAALLGTPRFDFDWRRYEAPAPLELTILTQPPVEIAPEPVRRAVHKPAVPKKRAVPVADAPRQPMPLPVASPSLIDAPSPDGEPLAVAETGAAPGTGEAAALSTVEPATEPGVETKPLSEYPLKRARLVYDLYYAVVNSGNDATRVGQLTHTWSLEGVRYEAAAVAEASGLVSLFFDGKFVQRATGELGAGGLVPERYTLDRGRGERVESAQFDWAGHKLALAWKKEARTVDLPVGALDPLSLMYQMYFVQPVPAAASVNVVTSRKLSRYVVRLAGEESLATPMGNVRTLRFRHEEDGGTTIDVWLDQDRNLLPARVYTVDRRGNALDQVISEARLESVETAAVSRP
jgi:hypothetical protein